ncbi:hypothetical protein CFP56_032988 [Quercus suber]|uniref:Uncharacterized protein n=1 Tax=Quercus suber TaxID=58331 RepID=A0AAW0JF83_QUESU
MACETQHFLPPKNLEEKVNHASDSDIPGDGTVSNPVHSESPFLVPPLQPSQPILFDQLLAEIDRDIHCFDRVAPGKVVSHAYSTTENLEPCQHGDTFMAAPQINIGDIKKDDGIKHGGCTVEIERSNQVPLGGNVQIKNGESGLGNGPGKENLVRPNVVGPKSSTNILLSADLEVNRPRTSLKDLTNVPGSIQTQQGSLGSKWTRLSRPTYEPKPKEAIFVKSRDHWILKFPTARLHHLPGSSPDHKPLWLVSDDLQTWFNRAQKPFRFEAMWLKDERCKGVVHSVWDKSSSGDPVSKVLRKVGEC